MKLRVSWRIRCETGHCASPVDKRVPSSMPRPPKEVLVITAFAVFSDMPGLRTCRKTS